MSVRFCEHLQPCEHVPVISTWQWACTLHSGPLCRELDPRDELSSEYGLVSKCWPWGGARGCPCLSALALGLSMDGTGLTSYINFLKYGREGQSRLNILDLSIDKWVSPQLNIT